MLWVVRAAAIYRLNDGADVTFALCSTARYAATLPPEGNGVPPFFGPFVARIGSA